jgi:hypothetical protein
MTKRQQRVIVKAWNTVLFDKFLRFKHLLVDGSPRTATRRSRVPDTRRHARARHRMRLRRQHAHIARRVGAQRPRVGVDCAPRFVEAARAADARRGRRPTRSSSWPTCRPTTCAALRRAFSRFGTMFFNLPGAALRNVRKALVPEASSS